MPASVVIVAAGNSSRMGFDKLRADLCGHSVLWHSVSAFDQCPSITEIILVMDPQAAADIDLPLSGKIRAIVPGGQSRHLSVWAGIQQCQENIIAVHDGARPLITVTAIESCLTAAASHGAAALARPITETLKRADQNLQVIGGVDRTQLWAMETPQAFHADILRRAYQEILKSGEAVTDEVSAVQKLGHPVQLVPHEFPNPKITYPADLENARLLISARPQPPRPTAP